MALRLATWNVGGLRKRCRNKNFNQFVRDFDVVAVQETLALASTRKISVPGFQVFKRDAIKPVKGRPIGGLAFFVSFAVLNSFSVEVESLDDCPVECLALRFTRLPSAQEVGVSAPFPQAFGYPGCGLVPGRPSRGFPVWRWI
jgi:exonuclease III